MNEWINQSINWSMVGPLHDPFVQGSTHAFLTLVFQTIPSTPLFLAGLSEH